MEDFGYGGQDDEFYGFSGRLPAVPAPDWGGGYGKDGSSSYSSV